MAIFRGEGGSGDATGDATNQAAIAQAAASQASASASNASASASNAATSAANALISASSAATSATNAANSYDSFDDRYLGAKSSAPSVDNDGNTLLVGALYWDTSLNLMYIWNGSAWSSLVSGGTGTVMSVSGTGTVNGITLTGTVTSSGSLTLGGTLSGIGNAQLTNSSVTVNGTSISLGSSGTVTAANPNALTIGTGLSGTSYTGASAVTIAIDSTVATLTGSQTLTNKTLTNPTINGFTGNTDVINIGSGQFYKNASGNIGLGTTSPSYKLDIQNAGTFTGMSIGNTTTSGLTNLFIYNTVNTLTYGVSSGGSYMSYTGTGPLSFSAGGSDLFVFTQAGAFGVGGANYGTSGQVLTSQGSSSAPIWSSAGGMTLLGTITTTSGTTQTLSGLTLTNYKHLYITYNGVSSSGTSGNFRLLDANGSTNLTIQAVSSTPTNTIYGNTWINLSNGGLVSTTAGNVGTPPVVQTGNSVVGDTTFTTSSTSITFNLSASNFDAGSISVFGVS